MCGCWAPRDICNARNTMENMVRYFDIYGPV